MKRKLHLVRYVPNTTILVYMTYEALPPGPGDRKSRTVTIRSSAELVHLPSPCEATRAPEVVTDE